MAVEVKLMAYTEEELDQRIRDYFAMYHPLGYMTSLSRSYYDELCEMLQEQQDDFGFQSYVAPRPYPIDGVYKPYSLYKLPFLCDISCSFSMVFSFCQGIICTIIRVLHVWLN